MGGGKQGLNAPPFRERSLAPLPLRGGRASLLLLRLSSEAVPEGAWAGQPASLPVGWGRERGGRRKERGGAVGAQSKQAGRQAARAAAAAALLGDKKAAAGVAVAQTGDGGGQARPWAPRAMEIEKEFRRLDQADSWAAIYQDIRHEAGDFPCKVAKLLKNKNRNRYRDVSPFDHSRIKLQQDDNDYINASLIKMEEAHRSYILTQGPLPNTCGHFWEMVWEQKSRGVVMLNRVVEKGSIKCAQYWPQKEENEMLFEDTNLKLILISEDIKSYYTVRQLQLENPTTHETREILHFHYTTWPDFGVPESPASFLNFLFKVRESGSLSPEHGPVVVHCSAGIGRSGTFCLVDTCLVLMDKRKDPSSVDIKQVLLEMRKYRMGLIQTADQLRFSYLAVIEGAKFIMGDSSVQDQWKELSNEDLDPPPEHTPPPPRPPKRGSEMNNGRMPEPVLPKHRVIEEEVKRTVAGIQEKVPDGEQLDAERSGDRGDNSTQPIDPLQRRRCCKDGSMLGRRQMERNGRVSVYYSQHSNKCTSLDTELRKRTVDASPHSEELVKPEEEEEEENVVATWKPFLVNICVFTVLTAGAYLCYRACFH